MRSGSIAFAIAVLLAAVLAGGAHLWGGPWLLIGIVLVGFELMPTLVLYGAVVCMALRGSSFRQRWCQVAGGIFAVGVVLPAALNIAGPWTRRTESPSGFSAPAVLPRRIGIEYGGWRQPEHLCNDLCLLLLHSGQADEVVSIYPKSGGAEAFRLAAGEPGSCANQTQASDFYSFAILGLSTKPIMETARRRWAGGECVQGRDAASELPEWRIRFPGALGEPSVMVADGGRVLARKPKPPVGPVAIPLRIAWVHEPRGLAREPVPVESVAAWLGRATSMRLQIADPVEARARASDR